MWYPGRGVAEDFYEVLSELVKDEEGVGIGLYLTREILQEQGGYIKVSSVYGQRSKFSIYLPKNNF